ncbi:MAG: Sec-independent protein translocase subunit TatA/TatB, partial [Flavobacteriales bacterium]
MVLILNDVAGSEIVLILVFVLIFFGSKSIPTLARTLGRITRQVKDATSDIQSEIKKSSADMK